MDSGAMLDSLAPARRRLVIGVIVSVLAVIAVLAAVMVVHRIRGSALSPVDQSRRGPVLLVPGYGGSTTSLQVLAGGLTAAGQDATVVTLPGDGTGDLMASAAVLGDAASAVMRRTGAGSVDVIGYSAGGIVARLWLANGGAALTRRVILLGTPNHGTTLADLADTVGLDSCPTACRQLTTSSDLLARLNSRDVLPVGPTFVSIWTTQDQTVTPPDSARLDGAVNFAVQTVCADAQVAHSDLPRDALVQAIVVSELGAAAPVEFTPADCGRLRA